MIPFHVTSLTSPPGRTPERQVIALLQSLSALLNASGRDESHILALTLFIDATDAESYGRFKEHLLECFREFFPERLPPVSVVAEPPERRRFVSLEATLLASASVEASVVRKELDGLAYTVIEGPGGRQVHCGGITHPDRDQDIESRSRSSFERMEAVLGAERMTYGHVIRQWNYIETMLDVREDVQCYQVFNDVRVPDGVPGLHRHRPGGRWRDPRVHRPRSRCRDRRHAVDESQAGGRPPVLTRGPGG
jgi:enamine deaminase RidA (YjgF/YER057c/UK114 family)